MLVVCIYNILPVLQVLVAAFSVSPYAATYYRAGQKPFNPLLGETYECIREDKGWSFVSEQVSHHPPISSCYCESKNFVFWQGTSLVLTVHCFICKASDHSLPTTHANHPSREQFIARANYVNRLVYNTPGAGLMKRLIMFLMLIR